MPYHGSFVSNSRNYFLVCRLFHFRNLLIGSALQFRPFTDYSLISFCLQELLQVRLFRIRRFSIRAWRWTSVERGDKICARKSDWCFFNSDLIITLNYNTLSRNWNRLDGPEDRILKKKVASRATSRLVTMTDWWRAHFPDRSLAVIITLVTVVWQFGHYNDRTRWFSDFCRTWWNSCRINPLHSMFFC